MPLQRCQVGNKLGWRWGKKGKCYTGGNAKQKALKQALAIGKGKFLTDAYQDQINKESSNTFREILKNELRKMTKRKRENLKRRKSPVMSSPIALEKQYERDLKKIMRRFTRLTIESIKPVLKNWVNQNKEEVGDSYKKDFDNIKQKEDNILWYKNLLDELDDEYKCIGEITKELDIQTDIIKQHFIDNGGVFEDRIIFKKDSPVDELEMLNAEWQRLQQQIFIDNRDTLKVELFGIAINVNEFNKRQWQKVLKQKLNVEIILVEPWEDPVMRAWVNRNVNLIKGMTDDYIKQINETVLKGFQENITSNELAKQLTSINKNFTKNRTRLIARDQLNKLNGAFTRRRQLDAGVDKYIWRTSLDERVRIKHKAMEGKICRWDNPTVYANSVEEANRRKWKQRSSIGGVELHAGFDIQCRCRGEAVFDDIIDILNEEIEKEIA